MSGAEPFPRIRPVTADLLEADLDAGRLVLPLGHVEALRAGALGYEADFWVAETGDGKKNPRGQVGVHWCVPFPESADERSALGLQAGEFVPSIVSLEVPEQSRERGIGRALLRVAVGAVRNEEYDRVSLDVAVGNVNARALYQSEDFRRTGLRRPFLQYTRRPDEMYELEEVIADLMVKNLRSPDLLRKRARW